MKKLITIILILALLLPAAALAEYSPALGMTMNDFIARCNSVPAPIDSPYVAMKVPNLWTEWNGYNVAWFSPCKPANTTILLMSKDTAAGKSTAAGLDMIQIFSASDWLQLISVATRCAGLFSADLFGTDLSPLIVCTTLTYFYENKLESAGYTSYRLLDSENQYALSFFRSGEYYFQIAPAEVVQ